MTTNKRSLIDLEGILKTRAPKFNKWLPGFIVNWFKKIIHQDEINEIILTYANHEGLEFVADILKHLNLKVNFKGLENIDKEGKYVFSSNHPLGGLDGLAVLNALSNFSSDIKAVINDLLLNIEGLRPVFHGVNVYKKNTKEHLIQIDDLYKGEKQIVIFPAGLVSRKIKGKIVDLQWKKSFLSKAIQHKRDIVPIYVDGKNSNFFYNFAKIRKFLGFKFNYELILLPKEFFGYKNKTINITFGKPISYSFFDESRSIDEWVLFLRNETYKLAEN